VQVWKSTSWVICGTGVKSARETFGVYDCQVRNTIENRSQIKGHFALAPLDAFYAENTEGFGQRDIRVVVIHLNALQKD
jgi:hypothetical protein